MTTTPVTGAACARRTADTASPRPVLHVVSWWSLWALRSVGGGVCTTHGRHGVTAAGAPCGQLVAGAQCGQLVVTMGTMVSWGRSVHDARPTRRHRGRCSVCSVPIVVSAQCWWSLLSVGDRVCRTHGRHDVTAAGAPCAQCPLWSVPSAGGQLMVS